PHIRRSAHMQFYDALATLRALRAPVLALIGGADDTVDPQTTLAAAEILRQEGHRFDTHGFPGEGHSLIPKVYGVPQFALVYHDLLTAWAAEIVGLVPAGLAVPIHNP